ncbi:MAG: aspartyl/asparaginyl beta-hydroxylase domain-containing protein [Cyclobacteriaceae bacterium]
MLKNLSTHLKNSKKLKTLIAGTSIAKHLYWYDLQLRKAFGLGGVFRLLRFAATNSEKDEIAGNYNVKPLYNGPSIGDGINSSGATVWNYSKLKNPPIILDDPICRILEENAEMIIKEYKDNIQEIVTHPDNESLAENGDWKGIFLYGVGGKVDPKIAEKFKHTFEMLEEIPISKNFGFVLISKLTPGVHITPHCGSSNLRFRYHLGLEIPEPDKVKIRVGNRWQTWENGKAFGFDDSFEHEVVHSGKKDRVVLIVDTWNPSLSAEEIKIFDSPVFHQFGKSD